MSFSEWGDSAGIDRRKLIVIVISAVAAGAAIVLMALMLFNRNNPPAQAVPAPLGTAVGDAALEAAQPLEALVVAPAGVSWSAHPVRSPAGLAPVALPAHPQFGPTEVSANAVSGFEQTASGVLLAAANILGRVGDSNAQDSLVIGPERDAFIYANLNPKRSADPGEMIIYQGFRFVGQGTTKQALVELLLGRGASFQPSACTVDLRWLDGDWKLYAHSSSGCMDMSQAVSEVDRASFVPWGPG
jgi:hypothetical protein